MDVENPPSALSSTDYVIQTNVFCAIAMPIYPPVQAVGQKRIRINVNITIEPA